MKITPKKRTYNQCCGATLFWLEPPLRSDK